MSFIKDPCGIFCVFIVYSVVFYSDYVVIKWIILQTMQNSLWAPINVVLFNTIIFFLTIAHLKAVFCDPGLVPLDKFSEFHGSLNQCSEDDDWTMCVRCETIRPPRAHHCRICKRCIRRMDHHCPWINNCVGERNQKYFLQFLLYVCILSVYAVSLVISSWIYPCSEDICMNDLSAVQARMLHSVLLLLISSLFGLFVIAIMIDQLHAIFYDETPIEALQFKGSCRTNPKLMLLAEVFGNAQPFCWLLPCIEPNFKEQPLLSYDV